VFVRLTKIQTDKEPSAGTASVAGLTK
jgi:hypothetical protein